MVTIRAAATGDSGAIARVHVESWRSTYAGIVPDAYLAGLDEVLRAQLWREWLSGGAIVLVAERGGEIVGFAHAGKIREAVASCDAELYSLYLLRDAQGRGIGSALLKQIATHLKRSGFGALAVWVLERNRSRLFYERAGAKLAMSKVIEIGGSRLMEVAYWWPDLSVLAEAE